MRLSQVKDFVNQIHQTQVRRALEELIKALELIGIDQALEAQELSEKMLAPAGQDDVTYDSDEDQNPVEETPEDDQDYDRQAEMDEAKEMLDEDEELSEEELKAEHDYVLENLPDDDEDLKE
jgi:hypothetical protein